MTELKKEKSLKDKDKKSAEEKAREADEHQLFELLYQVSKINKTPIINPC